MFMFWLPVNFGENKENESKSVSKDLLYQINNGDTKEYTL